MSSWPVDMIPLRNVMRDAAEISARQIGLGEAFDSFAEMCKQYGPQPPYPLAIDIHLAAYKIGGSRGMAGVLINNGTEEPVRYISERLIESFIESNPGLYIFRSGVKNKIDIEKMMGHDSIQNTVSEIPFIQEDLLIVVPAKKWEQFKRKSQILSDNEIIDLIGALSSRVTKAMAIELMKTMSTAKDREYLWGKAKEKFDHVGPVGRPQKDRS